MAVSRWATSARNDVRPVGHRIIIESVVTRCLHEHVSRRFRLGRDGVGSGGGVQLAIRSLISQYWRCTAGETKVPPSRRLYVSPRSSPVASASQSVSCSVRQEPGVRHGGFGDFDVVECRHTGDFQRHVTPMQDGSVAEVQVVFVDHHVVGVYLPGTRECRPRWVIDPRYVWRLAARGSGRWPQPDPDEWWLLEDGETRAPSSPSGLGVGSGYIRTCRRYRRYIRGNRRPADLRRPYCETAGKPGARSGFRMR